MKKLILLTAIAVLASFTVSAVAKTIYFNTEWSATPYAYVYYEGGTTTEYLGKWPGTQMTATSDANWYSVALPDEISSSALVIFNTNTGSDRYPADQEPGIAMPWLSTGQESAYYMLADKAWYDTMPAEKPVVTASPAGGRFSESVTVTLSCSMEVAIHYTTDGSEPSAESQVYDSPLTFTETTTLKTFVENNGSSNVQTFTYTYSEGGSSGSNYPSLNTAYYKTNPDGKVGTNRTIEMQHSNGISTSALSTWTDAELIAQGVANDIQQRFNGGHEWSLCDVYSLYAAYDAEYLYLGCQYVNTSGLDMEHSTPYSSMLPICVALDLDPNLDCSGAMIDGLNDKGPWQAGTQFLNFENGMDCLVFFHTQTAQGTPGVFLPTPDGKFSYDEAYCKTLDARAYQVGLLPSITSIYAKVADDGDAFYADAEYDGLYSNVGKIDDPNAFLQDESNYADVLPEWGSEYHTFYEIKISLATLGISEQYIKDTGIGVMWISTHGQSATSSIPYDPTCFDNVMEPYSKDPSTSMEKEDEDYFTYAMARIGKLNGSSSAVDETTAQMPVVYMQGKTVTVANNGGNNVEAFDLLGNRVFAAQDVEGDIDFKVPSKGTYIIVAGEEVVKVLVL